MTSHGSLVRFKACILPSNWNICFLMYIFAASCIKMTTLFYLFSFFLLFSFVKKKSLFDFFNLIFKLSFTILFKLFPDFELQPNWCTVKPSLSPSNESPALKIN